MNGFRHKEDNRANSLEVSVVQGEATSVIKSMNIKVHISVRWDIVESSKVNMSSWFPKQSDIESMTKYTRMARLSFQRLKFLEEFSWLGGRHYPLEGGPRSSLRLHRPHFQPRPGQHSSHIVTHFSDPQNIVTHLDFSDSLNSPNNRIPLT